MKPYYEEDGITIYHGDCRKLMSEVADIENTVVISDPPYGQTSLEWDRWDNWWLGLIPACIKSLWCFGSLRMFFEHGSDFRMGGWKLSQDLVWEKHNGSSFHSDRFRRVHESICHFYRGAWEELPHYVPTTPDATARTVRRKMRPPHMGNIDEGHYTSEDGGPRLMRSVIYSRSEHGRAMHPTQKPVEIIKPLIQYGSHGDGIVVVPFAGSGSELIAAKELGRRAIGIEIEEKYCEIAAKRLAQKVLNFEAAARSSQYRND